MMSKACIRRFTHPLPMRPKMYTSSAGYPCFPSIVNTNKRQMKYSFPLEQRLYPAYVQHCTADRPAQEDDLFPEQPKLHALSTSAIMTAIKSASANNTIQCQICRMSLHCFLSKEIHKLSQNWTNSQ